MYSSMSILNTAHSKETSFWQNNIATDVLVLNNNGLLLERLSVGPHYLSADDKQNWYTIQYRKLEELMI